MDTSGATFEVSDAMMRVLAATLPLAMPVTAASSYTYYTASTRDAGNDCLHLYLLHFLYYLRSW